MSVSPVIASSPGGGGGIINPAVNFKIPNPGKTGDAAPQEEKQALTADIMSLTYLIMVLRGGLGSFITLSLKMGYLTTTA